MSDSIITELPGNQNPSCEAMGTAVAGRDEEVGRYALHRQIAVGGMASIYVGWLTGVGNFVRVVAIKRMHAQFALDPEFVARFRDEAWLNARLIHPNIVQVLDVVEWNEELLIVMEYVHGVSLHELLGDAKMAGTRLPPTVIAGILVPALHGLHAAHEATDDDGNPLGIVHRDFSPHNIMVSRDGHAKVLDFGVAKSASHLHDTRVGSVSGKVGYMSPEQAMGMTIDRRADVFSAGVVLWEMLAGRRLFREPGLTDASTLFRVLNEPIRAPSNVAPDIPPELDRIAMRALERAPELRFSNAREMALALEGAISLASPSTIGQWIERLCSRRVSDLSLVLADTRRSAARAQPSAAEPPGLVVVPHAPITPPPVRLTAVPAEVETLSAAKQSIAGHKGKVVAGCTAILLATVLGITVRAFRRESSWNGLAPSGVRSAMLAGPRQAASIEHAPAHAPGDAVAASSPISAETARPIDGEHSIDREPQWSAVARRRALPGLSNTNVSSGGRGARVTPRPVSDRAKCNPPSYLDNDGIRVFKEECL